MNGRATVTEDPQLLAPSVVERRCRRSESWSRSTRRSHSARRLWSARSSGIRSDTSTGPSCRARARSFARLPIPRSTPRRTTGSVRRGTHGARACIESSNRREALCPGWRAGRHDAASSAASIGQLLTLPASLPRTRPSHLRNEARSDSSSRSSRSRSFGCFVRRAGLATALACAAVTALLAAPAPARAATGIQYGLTDDAWLLDGSGTLASRIARLQELGVGVVRFTLHWNAIAEGAPTDAADPNDAAYTWEGSDDVLQALRGAGISVVLQLLGTPAWANGGAGPNVAPTSATDFHDFATAAAKRYSWVKRWVIWNEPNQRPGSARRRLRSIRPGCSTPPRRDSRGDRGRARRRRATSPRGRRGRRLSRRVDPGMDGPGRTRRVRPQPVPESTEARRRRGALRPLLDDHDGHPRKLVTLAARRSPEARSG